MHTTRIARAAFVYASVAGALSGCSASDDGPEILEVSPAAPTRPRDKQAGGGEGASDGGVRGVTTPADGGGGSLPAIIGAPLPAAPPCVLDTRSVYVEAGRKLESITAYGRYWSRELKPDGTIAEGLGFPREVASDLKFSTGPCAGNAPCVLETRAVHFDGAEKLESTTAYGKAYQWGFALDGTPKARAGFPQPLSAIPAIAAGPCAGKGAACKLDTRAFDSDGASTVQTVTAYGKLHRFTVSGGTTRIVAPSDVLIESVPRYEAGPCRGQNVGACKLDTHSVYRDLDGGKTEEITAQGRLWVFRLAANGTLAWSVIDGAALADIPRLAAVCKP